MIKTLKGLLTVAPRKEIRYYMNGIHVTAVDGVVRMEVTDGSMGMCLDVKSNMFNVVDGTDVILCATSLSNLLKLFNTKSNVALTVTNELAHIGEHRIDIVEGRFPDLQRVLNNSDHSNYNVEVGLDFDLLSKICKASSLVLHRETFKVGKFKIQDGSSPFFIEREFNEGWDLLRAVISPVRL